MRTLVGTATVEVVIKHSRFLAHAARVDSLADTLAFHESVADPGATHNCWAWKLDQQYRFNDDGEPSGTAGKPIYSSIEGKGLDHVMVVVTRYYGGIKLGVGGLVRAYSGSAARCIDQATIAEIRPRVDCLVTVGFEWTGQVYAALEAGGARKTGERFTDNGIEIGVSVDQDGFESLRRLLLDSTRGQAAVRRKS